MLLHVLMSVVGFLGCYQLIPRCTEMFLQKNISGQDLGKKEKKKIPEAGGVISGCVFLMITILMIVIDYGPHIMADRDTFPHAQFAQLLAALLSIVFMLFLGFVDDVLDLRWRFKLLLPTMASFPLLMVYYVSSNRTEVVVPLILRPFLGLDTVNLGILYYVYMGMLAVFCTNAINILAGINGLEVGQSVVIAISIMIFNFCHISGDNHRFSLYFLSPYVATTLPLLWYNWYPSQIFPGDTFCYFSGMTLAVVAILGHFGKTLLLFFIPQVINFVYSVPQLFRLIPCPRHRLPKYNEETDLREMSTVEFKASDLKPLGKLCLYIFSWVGLGPLRRYSKDSEDYIEINNLTIINLTLRFCGPTHEKWLTVYILLFQVACSCLAFLIRYPLAKLFYGEIIA